MTTPLWDFYDGVPFMENPHLGILAVNKPPRSRFSGRFLPESQWTSTEKAKAKRKRGKKMAKRRQPAALKRYWAKHRHKARGRKRSPARRRRARKNWISAGAVVPVNPRRRRRSHRRNPVGRKRRRSSYSRNPAFLGIQLPAIKTVVFAGVGFAGPSFVSGFLTSTFPTVMQQTTSLGVAGKYLVKVGSIVGLAWLTRRFIGTNESHAVMVGGAVNVGLSLVNDFAPGILPANPLSMYVPTRPSMHAYVPVKPGLRAVTTRSPYTTPVSGMTPNVLQVQTRNIPRAASSDNAFNIPSRYLRY